MTKKLYYTCEYEANYMAKHHNVNWKQSSDTNFKYEVLPDSHHIFEPQMDDVISFFGGMDKNNLKEEAGFLEKYFTNTEGLSGVVKIIQRNGKAFFMPEVE